MDVVSRQRWFANVNVTPMEKKVRNMLRSVKKMAKEAPEEEDLSVDSLAFLDPATKGRDLVKGDIPLETLPSLQELTDDVKQKTSHLATARLTYGADAENPLFVSNKVREALLGSLRFKYFSSRAPRCNSFRRGTGEDFHTVFHLVAFSQSCVRYVKHKNDASKKKFWKVECEYEIPSTFTLTDLADILKAEVQSQNVYVKLEQKQYATAFWIGGMIYKDEQSSVDLGDQFQRYMADATGSCESAAKPMKGMVLRDMALRLGEPFVFLHEREEPQALVFSDMVFSTAPANEYPITLFGKKQRIIKCGACGANYACKLTLNSKNTLSERHWWCKSCFDDFHFDKDGNCMEQGPNFVAMDYD